MVDPDFGRCINEYLQILDVEDSKPRTIGIYYPSELGFPCLRALYLKYKYPDKQASPEKLRIFKIGEVLHKFLQEALCHEMSQFKVTAIEQSVTYKHNGLELRGRADAIIQLPDGEECVVELKTCNQRAFDYPLPKPEHLAQTMFYLARLHLKTAYIIYVDKDRLEIHVCPPVTYDPKIFREMVGRAQKLHESLLKQELPDKEPDFWNGKICGYCDFASECEKVKT